MNKNKSLIIIVITLTIAATSFVGFYSINNSKSISSLGTSTNSDSSYAVPSGLKEAAKAAVPAVVNFDTQNTSESTDSRDNRLSLYFSGSSPVYNYDQNNLTSGTTKTTSVATSVESTESEGSNLNIIVNVKTTFLANNQETTIQRAYWVKLLKLQDGSLIAYDLGVNK
jgi:hypothetical protein